jgi:hypothetical protein
MSHRMTHGIVQSWPGPFRASTMAKWDISGLGLVIEWPRRSGLAFLFGNISFPTIGSPSSSEEGIDPGTVLRSYRFMLINIDVRKQGWVGISGQYSMMIINGFNYFVELYSDDLLHYSLSFHQWSFDCALGDIECLMCM